MTRVFISSTSRDLKDHRAAVRDAVLELGMHPVMMEHFPAMDADAVEACRQKVLDCDLFIGIYAHRYGYVPAGEAHGITELEYDWAAAAGLSRHVFVVDPAYDWPSEHKEAGDAADKLAAFRLKIGGSHVWKQYTTPDSLKAAVTASLSHDLTRISTERRRQRNMTVGGIGLLALLLLGIIAVILFTAFRDEQRENDQLTQTAVAAAGATETAMWWTPTPTVSLTPTVTYTPTVTSTPPEGERAAWGETVVVVAQFEERGSRSNPQRSIREEIEAAARDVPGVRVISVGHPITGRDQSAERAEARRVLDVYNATLVIYGYVEDGGVSVSYEVTPRRSFVATQVEGRFRVAAGDIDNMDAYLFQGMDSAYVVGLTVGQLFYYEQNYEDALIAFDLAAERLPVGRELDMGAGDLFFYRGYIFDQMEEPESALAAYTQAIEFGYSPAHWAYNNRGNAYLDLERFEDAVADYNQALIIYPDYALAYNNRGLARSDLGDYEAAIADFTQAIALDHDPLSWVYNNRGWVYAQMGRHEEALADYDQTLELDPNYAWAYNNRGKTYTDLGDYEAAIADFNQAIALDHDPLSWPYTSRGWAQYNLNNYEAAIADFTRALEYDPAYAIAYNNRGLAYTRQLDYQNAIADFTQAIALDHTPLNWPYANRGYAYVLQGELELAVADYSQAIELDPTYVLAFTGRGLAYRRLERYEEALADYTRALELDPNNAFTFHNRGQVYAALERYEEAIADYTRTIELYPDHLFVYQDRGYAYEQLGRDAEARADYNHDSDPFSTWGN